MSVSTVGLEELDELNGNASGTISRPTILPPDERALARVQNIVDQLDASVSNSTGKSLNDRASLGAPAPVTLEEVQSQNSYLKTLVDDLESKTVDLKKIETNKIFPDFPNLAFEAVKMGLAKEKVVNGQLNKHIEKAEEHQKDIDLLLDFSAMLTAHKEGTEMSKEMKDKLEELQKHGIDLWKGKGTSLTKDEISQLKSLSSAQVDKLRSNLQIIFTTKIQVLIQSIGAIMETLKDIIRQNNKLIDKFLRLHGQ